MSVNSAFSVITAIILIGCATEEDKIRKAVEEYQALNMNDFSSYEFVSLTLDSAITHAHNISSSIAHNIENLEYWKNSLKGNEEFYQDLKGFRVQLEGAKKWEEFIEGDKKIIEGLNYVSFQLDSLLNSMGAQASSKACEVYDYSYREKNEFGVVVLRKTKLYLTPELKVEWIALNDENQKRTCNELPVLIDIVTKVWDDLD
jgi:hypothetical protein